MGGRMGGTNITVKNLKVIAVDSASHLIAVSGSIPGANKGIVKLSKNG
jgi:large subunit ribosomal protein L3